MPVYSCPVFQITVNGVNMSIPNNESIAQYDNTLIWKTRGHQTRILMGDTLYVRYSLQIILRKWVG